MHDEKENALEAHKYAKEVLENVRDNSVWNNDKKSEDPREAKHYCKKEGNYC